MGLTDSHAGKFLPLEDISGNRRIIDPSHEAIHEGRHFTVSYDKFVATSGSVSSIVITAPATASSKYIHFVCGVESDKAATWKLYKGSSVSGGSALTSYNNRLSSTNTGATVVANPTFTTYGTAIESHIIGSSGNPVSATGGGVESRNEWILQPGSVYTILVTTGAASANTVINVPYYYRTSD